VSSGAYQRALGRLDPKGTVELIPQACPQFVGFVERGDTTSRQLFDAAETYLTVLRMARVDTVILGCTHYPLLQGAIHHVMGDDVLLVSSAAETAKEVYEVLTARELLAGGERPEHRFESSGDPGSFARLLTLFMAPAFDRTEQVRLDRSSAR
jgi:glutamate racemase